jgi:hypothetical protein
MTEELAPQNHPQHVRVDMFYGRGPAGKRVAIGGLYRHRQHGHFAECWRCLRPPMWQATPTPFSDQRSTERAFTEHQRTTHGGI